MQYTDDARQRTFTYSLAQPTLGSPAVLFKTKRVTDMSGEKVETKYLLPVTPLSLSVSDEGCWI